MTTSKFADSRLRAYIHFVAAIFYYFLARALARHSAQGLVGEHWAPLVEQAMLVFLLLVGYAGMGFSLNRQPYPVAAQGLPSRPGWPREVAIGLALGWATAVVCVAAVAIDGGIVMRISSSFASWGWLFVDIAFFALWTLAEEITFRGYPFQRFARAVGPVGAVLGFALLYAFLQALLVGASHASIAVSFLFALVLSTAYLRTRALWVSWGINFAWKASRALLFGLTVSGLNNLSPVVQGDPTGPFWITGGGFGLEGSWFTFFVFLALWILVYQSTRDLDFRYNAPQFIPGGIPVDLDAAARRQHETAMGQNEPAPAPLVQIAPMTPPPNASPSGSTPSNPGNETR